jgi:hypothetical protein
VTGGGWLDDAVAEVHAARAAMRDAFHALDRALSAGGPLDPRSARLIVAEMQGTAEETARLAALLDSRSPKAPVQPVQPAEPGEPAVPVQPVQPAESLRPVRARAG